MSSPVETKQMGEDQYWYDGQTHKINGFDRVSIAVCLGWRLNSGLCTEIKMRSQLLFWGAINPQDTAKLSKQDMKDVLRKRLVALQPLKESSLPIYPREVFQELESLWNDTQATPPPAAPFSLPTVNNSKRRLDQSAADFSEGPQNKKIKEEDTESDGVSATISLATDGQQTRSIEEVGQTVPAASVSSHPELSVIWENILNTHEMFKAKNYYALAVGHYWINCPLIEAKYPGLEGELHMVIRELNASTQERGLLEAHLDLGIMKGTAVMAPGFNILQDWCYRQQRQRQKPPQEHKAFDTEMRRLQDTAYNWRRQAGTKRLMAAPPDLEKPLHLSCEVRLYEDNRGFLQPSQIFGDVAHLTFTNRICEEFKGEINLPMISDEPVEMSGVRFDPLDLKHPLPNRLLIFREWLSYDTTKVKYGPAWNKNPGAKASV